MSEIIGAIFDLDGVLVDTAKYHYLAWKRLAAELGFNFTEKENEQLKGVSRMRSLEILLEIGNIHANEKQKEEWAQKKNEWYVEYLNRLDKDALLPGTEKYLEKLQKHCIKIALGSASKNAPLILEKLHITSFFNALIDGNCIEKAKPDPEIFLKSAEAIHLQPKECVVFEDSEAGICAAKNGGMMAVGIGSQEIIPGADLYAANLSELCNKKFLLEG
jgi:beta-phosphoglucomutase